MSHFQDRLALFRTQPFRWYFLSTVLATFGNGLIYIASTWLALKIHNTVGSVALLMLFFWVPFITFGPLGGVIADRYSRKTVLVIGNYLRAICAIVLAAILFWSPSIWLVYIFNALIGTLVAAIVPATLAFTPEIIDSANLLNANATIDLAYEVGNVIGMGSAGIVISLLSTQAAFFICSACFLLSGIAMQTVQYKKTYIAENTQRSSYFTDFREGLLYLRNKKNLFIIYIIQLLLMVDFMTAPILLGPFAKNFLHASADQFGAIEASLSVGVVIGGLMTPFFIHKIGWRKIVLTELFVMTIAFTLFILIHKVINAEILYFIIGLCLAIWPVLITAAQEQTSKNFQARLQSNFISLAGMLTVIMFLMITFVSQFIAINELYWFEVLFTAIAGYLTWQFCHPQRIHE